MKMQQCLLNSPEQRFWAKVAKTGGCWIWKAGKDSYGYGIFHPVGAHQSAPVRAYRYSYELNVGNIPEGMLVCHKCDNPACVRPDHLFLGTYHDNNLDRESKGRGVHPRTENHPRAKLTAKIVLVMRQMRKEGATYREIAGRYGVGEITALYAIKGRTWRTIEESTSEKSGDGEDDE